MKCLDVGCGNNKEKGCIGIDAVPLEKVDVVHDLDIFPWPFEDNEFDRVVANHYLEHSRDIVRTLEEIHRIVKNDGDVYIRVPHYASDNFHTDLTHRNAFGWRSLDHFSVNGTIEYNYYSDCKFEIVGREIRFVGPGKFDPFKVIGVSFLANRFPRIYERFFVYWLPPTEIFFQLKVVK